MVLVGSGLRMVSVAKSLIVSCFENIWWFPEGNANAAHLFPPPLFVCNYSVERSGGTLRAYGAVQNEQKRVTRNFSRSVEAGAASAHIVRYGVSYFAP